MERDRQKRSGRGIGECTLTREEVMKAREEDDNDIDKHVVKIKDFYYTIS